MPKLTRTLVLGAMLAVLSSATAAVAQEPAASDQAVQQFRAGERPRWASPSASDQAVQRFRAGERSSQTRPPLPTRLCSGSAPASAPRRPVRLGRRVVAGPAAPLVLRVHQGPAGRRPRAACRARDARRPARRPGRRRGPGPLAGRPVRRGARPASPGQPPDLIPPTNPMGLPRPPGSPIAVCAQGW